mmetsp:Transcript_16191/g.54247  ORF Transcript_16191/g.54247 Transcript_16191/m.54247 type:complete len:207 (-) Transcript_16191:1111-1731(-)
MRGKEARRRLPEERVGAEGSKIVDDEGCENEDDASKKGGDQIRPAQFSDLRSSTDVDDGTCGCRGMREAGASHGGDHQGRYEGVTDRLGEEGNVLGVREVVDDHSDAACDDVRADHHARLREGRARGREDKSRECPVRAQHDGVVSLVTDRTAGPGGVGDCEEPDEGANKRHSHALDVHPRRWLPFRPLPFPPVFGEEASNLLLLL